tara:strand:- start:479 stop:655 length:177 start_codon:yes stop_codon:yes gene_type:complete
MATTVEWILWTMFMLGMSLLFFAAFGGSKYSESSIDEYMEKLEQQILEEERNQRGPTR